MADTLSAQFALSARWSLTEAQDLSSIVDADSLDISQDFADGTGDQQATVKWSDQRTLAASATETLDLTALTETIYGTVVTKSFATIKKLIIQVTTTTSGADLRVGAAASNPWVAPFAGSGAPTTATHDIKAGGTWVLLAPYTGYAVTNSSSDNLKLANQSGVTSLTYKILIIGT